MDPKWIELAMDAFFGISIVTVLINLIPVGGYNDKVERLRFNMFCLSFLSLALVLGLSAWWYVAK